MSHKPKRARRWPWYIAIGILTPLLILAIQSAAIGLTARECAKLEHVNVSMAAACKWERWTDPSLWLNMRLLWIGGAVLMCVALALWQANVHSRRGLNGGPRDAHAIREEYRPIVNWLIAFTIVALFVNLVNAMAGRM
jgi:hypothetical protein